MSFISRFRKTAGFLERSLYRFSERGRLVAEVLLGGMILLIVVDVILRYAFNQALSYSLELVELALCLTVFFGLFVCTARQGHVHMDILITRFSQRVQAAINSFVYFLSTALFGIVSWRFFVHAVYIKERGLESPILGIPHYPFVYVIALCSLLVFLLLLSQFIRFTAKAVSK